MPDPALPQYLSAQIQLRRVPFLALRAPALDHLMLYHLQWRHRWQIDHFPSSCNALPTQFVVAVRAVLQCMLPYLGRRHFLPRCILFSSSLLARFVWLLALLFMLIGFYEQRWFCFFLSQLVDFYALLLDDYFETDYLSL